MINVCVYRSPCVIPDSDCSGGSELCKTGPDVSDALIVTEEAARARGQAEIDESYTNRKLISGSVYLIPWIQPGSIINVTDVQVGSYNALLRAMSVTISRNSKNEVTATSSIQFEKHYDD